MVIIKSSHFQNAIWRITRKSDFINKFFKGASDVIAVVFTAIGLPFLIVGLVIFFSSLSDGATDLATALVLLLAFGLTGAVFLAIGIICVVYRIKKNNQERMLKQEGERIWADFWRVERVHNVNINGRNPYVVYCKYYMDGIEYVFKSGMIKNNVEDSLAGKQIPVYYDRNNMKNYFVDIDEMISNNMVFL